MVSSRSQIKTRSGGFTASMEGVSLNVVLVGLEFCCRLPLDLPLEVGVILVADVLGEIDRGDVGEWEKRDGVSACASDGLSGKAAI